MRTGSPSLPDALIAALNQAQRVAVLTGAGISAESGVPTFREAQTGLWARFDPADLATPEAFRRDPKLVWEWYEWRRSLIAQALPNPGHRALADLQRLKPGLTLVTQNVDGLHQRAGSTGVIELHGNLWRNKCFEEDAVLDTWVSTPDGPPRCGRCQGLVRPDVVWFGEALPPLALAKAEEAAAECEVFFSIGTSALVQPAASLPHLAREHGAMVVEINPDRTPLTAHANIALSEPAGQALPALVRAAWPDA